MHFRHNHSAPSFLARKTLINSYMAFDKMKQLSLVPLKFYKNTFDTSNETHGLPCTQTCHKVYIINGYSMLGNSPLEKILLPALFAFC